MSVLTAIKQLNRPVFTTRELAAYYKGTLSNTTQALNYLEKKGVVLKIKRGVWGLNIGSERLSPYMVISFLSATQRLYVSFITALHLYGIIEQIPHAITLASTSHTRTIKTKLGTFFIHRISPSFFKGFDWYKNGGKFLIAEPEKALVDCLYISSRRKNQFEYFPELHFSKSFSFKKAEKWADEISDLKIRKYVFGKLKNLNKIMLCVFILVVSGCATTGYTSKGKIYTGMNQKIITKDSSGEITQKSEPIKVKPSYNVSSERPENYREFDDYSMNKSYHYSNSFSLNELEINFVSSKLSHSYTSNFQSSDFQNLRWSSNPQISGTGGEMVFIRGDKKNRYVSFIFGGGGFKNKHEINVHSENNFYVREKTKTTSFWAHMGIHARPFPWIYLQGLLGAFSFDVNTDLETNASVYK